MPWRGGSWAGRRWFMPPCRDGVPGLLAALSCTGGPPPLGAAPLTSHRVGAAVCAEAAYRTPLSLDGVRRFPGVCRRATGVLALVSGPGRRHPTSGVWGFRGCPGLGRTAVSPDRVRRSPSLSVSGSSGSVYGPARGTWRPGSGVPEGVRVWAGPRCLRTGCAVPAVCRRVRAVRLPAQDAGPGARRLGTSGVCAGWPRDRVRRMGSARWAGGRRVRVVPRRRSVASGAVRCGRTRRRNTGAGGPVPAGSRARSGVPATVCQAADLTVSLVRPSEGLGCRD